MRDSPLSPRKIRMAAGAYAELEPPHSAVVASSLERVEQEIAAGVGARPAGMGQPEPLTGLDRRRNPLKGLGAGVAVSGIALLVASGSPGERLPGRLWRHWGGRASVRASLRAMQG